MVSDGSHEVLFSVSVANSPLMYSTINQHSRRLAGNTIAKDFSVGKISQIVIQGLNTFIILFIFPLKNTI